MISPIFRSLRRSLCVWGLWLSCVALCSPGLASAQAAEPLTQAVAVPAQTTYAEALKRLENQQWNEARELLLLTAELDPHAATTYWNLAVASYGLKLGREALQALADFESRADLATHVQYRDRATALRLGATELVGTLLLAITPDGAQLELDSQPVEGDAGTQRTLIVEPGTHVLSLHAPGFQPRTLELHFAPGEVVQERVDLVHIPDAFPQPSAAVTVQRSAAATALTEPQWAGAPRETQAAAASGARSARDPQRRGSLRWLGYTMFAASAASIAGASASWIMIANANRDPVFQHYRDVAVGSSDACADAARGETFGTVTSGQLQHVRNICTQGEALAPLGWVFLVNAITSAAAGAYVLATQPTIERTPLPGYGEPRFSSWLDIGRNSASLQLRLRL